MEFSLGSSLLLWQLLYNQDLHSVEMTHSGPSWKVRNNVYYERIKGSLILCSNKVGKITSFCVNKIKNYNTIGELNKHFIHTNLHKALKFLLLFLQPKNLILWDQ